MSYRCENCNAVRPNGEAPIRKVVEFRQRIYPVRRAKDNYTVIDRGGSGSEIVREMSLCPDCARKDHDG